MNEIKETQFIGIFQIGPVQDFIKNSRKLRDLWASSYLLSYLIYKAIKETGQNNLIYPSPKVFYQLEKYLTNNFVSSFPNKFVTIFDNKDDLVEKFKNAESKVKETFKEECSKIFNDLKNLNHFNTHKLEVLFNRHINNFIDIYWIISPLENDYSESYRRAEILFNSRKSIRNFNNIKEEGYKCTLCGEREPISNNSNERQKIKDDWKKISEKYKHKFRENEHLCFICTLKRLYKEDIKFPSTSTFAVSSFLLHLLENINKNEIKEKIKELYLKIKGLEDLITLLLKEQISSISLKKIEDKLSQYNKEIKEFFSFEGELFYKETYDNLIKLSKEQKLNSNIVESINEIKDIIEELYKEKVPSKYYAVIQYDGDNIGKELFKKKSLNEHMSFSETISKLSEFVLNLQKEYLFRSIYIGGDEGIIFSSISDALNIIQKIDEEFKRNNLTASFSLILAHYTHPLSEVLEKSREGLKKAKGYCSDKNSLCINLIKRSGEEIELIKNLKTDKINFLYYFNEIINCYKRNEISKRWWKSLVENIFAFQFRNNEYDKYLDKELLTVEIKRLIKRKIINKSSNFEKTIEDFIKDVISYENGMEEFIKSMGICEFMARED